MDFFLRQVLTTNFRLIRSNFLYSVPKTPPTNAARIAYDLRTLFSELSTDCKCYPIARSAVLSQEATCKFRGEPSLRLSKDPIHSWASTKTRRSLETRLSIPHPEEGPDPSHRVRIALSGNCRRHRAWGQRSQEGLPMRKLRQRGSTRIPSSDGQSLASRTLRLWNLWPEPAGWILRPTWGTSLSPALLSRSIRTQMRRLRSTHRRSLPHRVR